MVLARTLSQEARRTAALSIFNVSAKPFTPGKQWMKPKKITWSPIGVTKVKYFDYTKGSEARMRGISSSLKGLPGSSIKNANPKEALPFLIPKPYTAKKIIIKKIPEKKLKEKGYPTVFMDSDLLEVKKSKNMEELREIYNCCKELQSEPKLARTQPDRFNYCDN